MRMLATLGVGLATAMLAAFGNAAPAAANADAFVGVQVGPLRVGAGIDEHRRHRHHGYRDGDGYRDCYTYDCGDGFYSGREYYVPRYDRRYSPDPWAYRRFDGYAGYRRHHNRAWDDGNYPHGYAAYWGSYEHHHHRRRFRHRDYGFRGYRHRAFEHSGYGHRSYGYRRHHRGGDDCDCD